MYPRRVFNVSFFFFCTYRKPQCFERTAIDALIRAITCRSAPCRFAFKCNTHQHPKTIQSFSLPQNFIRKSEPPVEHKKEPVSNVNPKVTYPQKPPLVAVL